ncbi:MAG TPA: DNA primase, partial [Ignavibacteria bacterium]|nr:DNA primase [Ignavibacteria bacterium]
EISSANDIIDVISGYIEVKKKGKSFLALCPFHPDKNPSLHISQAKQVYHCFSCKSSGNVYTFVQNFEKITFMEAVQKLALRAGIQLNYNSKDPDLSNELSKLFEINKLTAKYFHRNIRNLNGSEKEFIMGYLDERNIDTKLIEKFGIGYSHKSWDSLMNYFLEDGIFSKPELERAGVLVHKDDDNNDKYYDRFRGRLMFPIFSENDKVVGFGGRKLFEDDQGGKYINSPESRIYNKSRILYGLNFAKEKIRYYDFVIIVEGYMDLISLHKHEIENVVASSGTALSEEQVSLISRYTKNICLLFDSDLAGIKAAKRGIEIILEAGLDLSIISLPDGEDPDSFLNKHGKAEFEKYVTGRQSVINFISGLYTKENKLNTVEDKTNFIKEIIGYIGKIHDKIKRVFFIKEIAELYSLYESDLRDELEKTLKENKPKPFARSSVIIPEKKAANENGNRLKILPEEHEIIDLFINGNDEALNYLENNMETGFIRNPTVLMIIEYFLDEYINSGKIELSKALNDIENEDAKTLIATISISRHEASFFKGNSSDNLLNKGVEMEYNLKYAKDVIKKIRLRELEESRLVLKKHPDKYLEVFEITKQINDLKKKT